MIPEKTDNFTIDEFLNNEKMIENYLELLKNEDIDPSVYMTMMYLMHNNIHTVKSILVLADVLGRKGILQIGKEGEITIDGDTLTAEEKISLTESFCLVREIAPYLERLGNEEIEALSALFLNEVLGSDKNINTDSEEVQ